MKQADRRLVQRFWDGISLGQMAPLLGAAFFTFAAPSASTPT